MVFPYGSNIFYYNNPQYPILIIKAPIVKGKCWESWELGHVCPSLLEHSALNPQSPTWTPRICQKSSPKPIHKDPLVFVCHISGV